MQMCAENRMNMKKFKTLITSFFLRICAAIFADFNDANL